jgi:hypothetical protein
MSYEPVLPFLLKSFPTAYGYLALLFAALFLILLVLLHFLKPEFDPSWRMISEYEIGRFGWMMRVAFFCWGTSVLVLTLFVWPALGTGGGTIGRWWFLLITLALVGAGIFKTNPITDRTSNPVNTLHTLCGAIVILTFPIAATLVGNCLLHNGSWITARVPLIFGIVLVWVGMVSYFASIIISVMVDPTAGSGGPHVYQGWPNRFMVLTYIVWLMIVATCAINIL